MELIMQALLAAETLHVVMAIDPISLAIVGGSIMAASGGLGAIGNFMGGRSQRRAMNSQLNFLGEQRQQMDEMFGMKLDQFDQQGETFLSSQEQQIGLSGVSMEGSPLLAMMESEKNIAQDRDMLERERAMTLAGIDQEMDQIRRGRNASRQASNWGLASNITGAVGNVFGAIQGPMVQSGRWGR